jgi:hypothetical protein
MDQDDRGRMALHDGTLRAVIGSVYFVFALKRFRRVIFGS